MDNQKISSATCRSVSRCGTSVRYSDPTRREQLALSLHIEQDIAEVDRKTQLFSDMRLKSRISPMRGLPNHLGGVAQVRPLLDDWDDRTLRSCTMNLAAVLALGNAGILSSLGKRMLRS